MAIAIADLLVVLWWGGRVVWTAVSGVVIAALLAASAFLFVRSRDH